MSRRIERRALLRSARSGNVIWGVKFASEAVDMLAIAAKEVLDIELLG